MPASPFLSDDDNKGIITHPGWANVKHFAFTAQVILNKRKEAGTWLFLTVQIFTYPCPASLRIIVIKEHKVGSTVFINGPGSNANNSFALGHSSSMGQ
jgi:hypothetical protein